MKFSLATITAFLAAAAASPTSMPRCSIDYQTAEGLVDGCTSLLFLPFVP